MSGVIALYNVVDVKVTLTGGSYHEVDSSENAYKIAGSMAFKEAMQKSDPVLIEPIMKVVITPDDYMGEVIGDLNSCRGRIDTMEAISGGQQITCHVPLPRCSICNRAPFLHTGTRRPLAGTLQIPEVPKSVMENIMGDRR